MKKSEVEPENNEMPSLDEALAILDEIPSAIFILNPNLHEGKRYPVIGANRAAIELSSSEIIIKEGMGIGDFLFCSQESEDTFLFCGQKKKCAYCKVSGIIENTVKTGKGIYKKSVKLEIGGEAKSRYFIVTTAIIPYRGEKTVLFGLEDVTDMVKIQNELSIRREREIDIAAKIQKTLLVSPVPSDIQGAEIATLAIPSSKVDGDFFEIIAYSPRFIDFVIGDVMGKGLPAALVGAAFKNNYQRVLARLLYNNPKGNIPALSEIVSRLHDYIVPGLMELETTITLCFARFDLSEGKITTVDCGHTKTLHCSPFQGEISMIEGNNLPFGFVEKSSYQEVSKKLYAQDTLIFYSDGVFEARNLSGEFYGFQRFLNLIPYISQKSSGDIVNTIKESVCNFTESKVFDDDFTLIAIKIHDITGNSSGNF